MPPPPTISGRRSGPATRAWPEVGQILREGEKDNAVVQIWSEKTQLEKGDSLTKGYASELWDCARISITQNNLQEALVQFWNSAYSCFTFGRVDLVPTVEEYTVLLHCPRIQANKIYSRAVNVLTFVKKLMNITGMSENALGHIDETVSGLFDRLDRRFYSHFWKVDKVSYRVFSKSYSPLKELPAMPRRDDITEEKWTTILQNLKDEDVEWRAPWLVPDEILYRYRNFDWVPLLGIWGVVGYAPLLVLR
ncbi:hypothetical protein Godav_003979 [Gossypium davidsonii]|uniref:DUF7745 domain-containing protein n=1 Tax=Gossypium davidsonii TaxID=34287 RepID=A0A7J8SL75_GOSDV|nr:hypothetical protein [Gossypium davidsonii]